MGVEKIKAEKIKPEQKFPCPNCPQKCTRKNDLKKYWMTKHATPAEGDVEQMKEMQSQLDRSVAEKALLAESEKGLHASVHTVNVKKERMVEEDRGRSKQALRRCKDRSIRLQQRRRNLRDQRRHGLRMFLLLT